MANTSIVAHEATMFLHSHIKVIGFFFFLGGGVPQCLLSDSYGSCRKQCPESQSSQVSADWPGIWQKECQTLSLLYCESSRVWSVKLASILRVFFPEGFRQQQHVLFQAFFLCATARGALCPCELLLSLFLSGSQLRSESRLVGV